MAEAKTWDDLGAILGIDTRAIRRWKKEYGCPQTPDVDAWRQWVTAKGGAPSDPKTPVANDADFPGECAYDPLVKAGKISYEVAKERESVIGISIRNDAAKIETQKARGALVTREESERGAALVRDSLNQKFDRAIARALSALSDRLTPELRGEVVKAIESELDAE